MDLLLLSCAVLLGIMFFAWLEKTKPFSKHPCSSRFLSSFTVSLGSVMSLLVCEPFVGCGIALSSCTAGTELNIFDLSNDRNV